MKEKEIWNSEIHKKATELFNTQSTKNRIRNIPSEMFPKIQELIMIRKRLTRLSIEEHKERIDKRIEILYKSAEKEIDEYSKIIRSEQ